MDATVKAAALHGGPESDVTLPQPGEACSAGCSTAVTEEERIARATLTYLAEPGNPAMGTITRLAGGVRALEAIRAASLAGITGLPDTLEGTRALERLRARLAAVPARDEVRRTLDDDRFRLVCPGDTEWPAGLDGLGDSAPLALWVTGSADVALACRRSVAVTGSRGATAYGSYLAAELGTALAERGLPVVTGGSFGVDVAAYRGAASAAGTTVTVLPGGIDVPYPAAHTDLLGLVAAKAVPGGLVSEAPPGTLTGRLRFQARNRVIAALAAATVIVEAGTRSGAVTVARCARDLGRPVMAVPGPVTSELSAGCNDLIRSGHAVLVASADDVLDTLAAAGHPAG
jgi:DNA processing protein